MSHDVGGEGEGALPAARIWRPWLRVGLGLALLLAALALPLRPGPLADLRFPVEWFWAVALLALARGRAFGLLAAVVLALAAAGTILKLADWGTLAAFSRPFDPVVDRSILVAGWHLLSGTVGNAAALGALGAAFVLFFCFVGLLAYGLSGMRRLPARARRSLGAGALGGAVLATVILALVRPGMLPVSAEFSAYAGGKLAAARQSWEAQAAFSREVAVDPLRDRPPEGLLAALEGHDVVLVFVESYGRSALENPLFAPRTLARLEVVQNEFTAAGVGARSGWLRSPIAGGQSWLAHGTMLSGLLIDNQTRYESLLRSDHRSLNALFRGGGWRTVAVMPAITMPWPEAGWFGYDEVLAAKDLDYRGLAFNWVTMPDQFTLLRIGQILQSTSQPVMVQTALISSHAPWTPIPHMIPWEDVGDGQVFDAQARSGVAPEVLWRDPERVRENYGLSIDYAMEAVGSFVQRFARESVIVVVGDHQPAELVTGPNASRDVPLHVLSSDPQILARLDDWGLTPGMVPSSDAPSLPMQAFRERFVRSMSGGGHGT
ncbi:sulfatase-like hydrolase/transferase [Aureimonas phyllosphaerae]|uniref:sulfatase-like hydrolase/transferase n=1 Tax=Aureimonas phyllosphaerae TaxID=1166078 RepID=UPI003A5C1B24